MKPAPWLEEERSDLRFALRVFGRIFLWCIAGPLAWVLGYYLLIVPAKALADWIAR